MTRSSRVLIACALVLAGGCGGGIIGGGPSTPPPPTPMPPATPLYSDNGGGIRDSVRTVVRNAGELAEYWRRATSTQPSPPAVPTVDFTREMVIVVAAGRKTPEDQIRVDSLLVRKELTAAGKNEETLTIVVRIIEGCRRFRTDAFPLQIVRVRNFDGPIKWEERAAKATCGDRNEN